MHHVAENVSHAKFLSISRVRESFRELFREFPRSRSETSARAKSVKLWCAFWSLENVLERHDARETRRKFRPRLEWREPERESFDRDKRALSRFLQCLRAQGRDDLRPEGTLFRVGNRSGAVERPIVRRHFSTDALP